MSVHSTFLPLSGWEPTRDTLKLYSRAVGVVPRSHAEPHPKWWHVSLKVESDGLVTDRMSLPDGGEFWLKMDLRHHNVVLETSVGQKQAISMQEGLSATAMGDRILAAVAGLGLEGDYAREKFENDEARAYDPAAAENFLTAVVIADRIFKQHRATLSGEVGPVQLWPHGFDLAFEWFGTRVVEYEENGHVAKYPSQLNLGFSPGEPGHPEPYFYSNPWPFEEDKLLDHPLPAGARWFTEGWQGSILPYQELVGDSEAEARLLEYARTVHEISSPTLQAR